MRLFERFASALIARAMKREPNFVIGGRDDPYMLRWSITPWCAVGKGVPHSKKTFFQRLCSFLPGIYLHCVMRPDDDRALHDHPWCNCSVVLRGSYIEHSIAAGGINMRRVRSAGDVVFRWAKTAHRLELHRTKMGQWEYAWSLFFFGFRLREWGFHCPERGWVVWHKFVAADDVGAIGKGCEA